MRLWDALTGAHKRTLQGHTSSVLSVAFSPDGSTLASGSWDRTVRLWDALTGAHKRTLEGHTESVDSVAFSPDGGTLASGSGDGTVRLWDALAGAHKRTLHKRTLRGRTYSVLSVAFSPDGSTLASGSWDDTVHLWDALTGAHKRTLDGHTAPVESVAFSPDGSTLASGSWDDPALLWKFIPPATVGISPAQAPSPPIGAQLTLSLTVKDGKKVAGYQATITFDASALRYLGSANGDYLPVGAFAVPAVVTQNQVTLAATSLAGESNGNGTLATLSFEVIAVKPSTLRLSEVVLSDSAGKTSHPPLEDGQVVDPPQVTGDVNRDGVVNIQDLVKVASNFGQTGENDADVNGDGVVNIADLVLVAGAFGNAAAAPSARDLEIAPTRADVKEWLAQARQLGFTDSTSQRGIRFLEQLLAALTPKETILLPNYPNPFNPETWIPYRLANDSDVQIAIYDTKGELLRQLHLGHQPAGFYTDRSRAAYWDGRNNTGESVASGVYVYQLRAGVFSQVRRMVIVK